MTMKVNVPLDPEAEAREAAERAKPPYCIVTLTVTLPNSLITTKTCSGDTLAEAKANFLLQIDDAFQAAWVNELGLRLRLKPGAIAAHLEQPNDDKESLKKLAGIRLEASLSAHPEAEQWDEVPATADAKVGNHAMWRAILREYSRRWDSSLPGYENVTKLAQLLDDQRQPQAVVVARLTEEVSKHGLLNAPLNLRHTEHYLSALGVKTHGDVLEVLRTEQPLFRVTSGADICAALAESGSTDGHGQLHPAAEAVFDLPSPSLSQMLKDQHQQQEALDLAKHLTSGKTLAEYPKKAQ